MQIENEQERGRREDWTQDAEARLDAAEEAGDEARLGAIEEINEKLEAELDLDRPRPPAAEGAGEDGEAQPPGR